MKPTILLVCGVVLSFVLAALAVVGGFIPGLQPAAPYTGAPDDRELLAAFHAHRHSFDLVRDMAIVDGPALDNQTLNATRRRQYEALLAPIGSGLQVVTDTGETGTIVKFIFKESGSPIGSEWSKGIEYISGDVTRLGVIKTDLDSLQHVPDNEYLVPIEPHWYLIYDQQLD